MVGYRDIAIKVLKAAKEPMTPYQIWDKAIQMNIVDTNTIKGKTPMATLASLLLRETKRGIYKGKKTIFEYVDAPRRYWIKN